MRESIKVRVVSVLERTGLSGFVNDIASLTARYICRLIGAREFRKQIRRLLANHPEVQSELIGLKGSLDYSAEKNKLLRAIHDLANLKKPTRASVLRAAKQFSVDRDDLDFIYQALPLMDLNAVRDLTLSEDGYSNSDIMKILKQTEYLMRSLVYRRLSFVLNNDPMIETAHDLMSPLRIAAVKVIREYEIQTLTYEHMLNTVIKGIQNQARNMAESYGRGKRQPVIRVNIVDPYRIAWHLDVHEDVIRKVRCFQEKSLRRKIGDSVCLAVQDATNEEWFVVHHKRLYASTEEAQGARVLHANGGRSKREVFLDLAPQEIDDFQPNAVSIDNDEAEVNFHEYLPADIPVDLPEAIRRASQILHGLPRRTREFAELVFSSEVDELFDAWCEDKGYNLNTCDDAQLGRLACKYLNLTKIQLKVDLADSSAHLWNDHQRATIMRGIQHAPNK